MQKTNYVFIGDLEPFKAQAHNERKEQLNRLLEEANRYATFELPEVHPDGSTTYMGIAIVNLALAYNLTKEDKYLKEAKRFINTVLNYEKWGFAHLVNVDLSASWILFGLSLGYDWLKADLDQELRETITNKIEHHAKIMYDYKEETAGEGWATQYYQNHNWINLNGLATAGYVLQADGLNGQVYIDSAKENFKRVYEYMPEDGSNYEGVVYWRYGGMWLFVYAHLLNVQEGINYFETSEYLRNTFDYRLYQSAPDLAQQLNYGDAHDRHSGHTACVYYKVAAEYNNGYAQTFANIVLDEFLEIEANNSKVKPGILPEAVFEFLWFSPKVEAKPLAELPKVKYFPDLGLLSMRNTWDRDGKVFTIKCSAPGGKKQWDKAWELYYKENIDCLSLSHHHPDNLAYIYVEGSEFLTCEDGYNRNIMPDNHNVLLVDGQYTDVFDCNDVYVDSAKARLAQNPDFDIVNEYRGDVMNYVHQDDMVGYYGDTTKIYKEAAKMTEVSRTVFSDDLEFMVFLDRFVSKEDHKFSVISNTNNHATKNFENAYTYALNNKQLGYVIHSDVEITEKQYDQDVVGVMTTQEPDKVCRVEIKSLYFETKQACKKAVMFECFVPANIKVVQDHHKVTIHAKKQYECIAREGFEQYGITSNASMYVIIHDGQTETTFEI